MASRKKSTKQVIFNNEPNEQEVNAIEITEPIEEKTATTVEKIEEKPVKKTKKPQKVEEEVKDEPKYKVGSIVYISKDAEADLNGFKLFPQYKKYTYTVEAYNDDTGVYSLRRLNLSLKLKEADIVSPHEKSDSSLIRRQF